MEHLSKLLPTASHALGEETEELFLHEDQFTIGEDRSSLFLGVLRDGMVAEQQVISLQEDLFVGMVGNIFIPKNRAQEGSSYQQVLLRTKRGGLYFVSIYQGTIVSQLFLTLPDREFAKKIVATHNGFWILFASGNIGYLKSRAASSPKLILTYSLDTQDIAALPPSSKVETLDEKVTPFSEPEIMLALGNAGRIFRVSFNNQQDTLDWVSVWTPPGVAAQKIIHTNSSVGVLFNNGMYYHHFLTGNTFAIQPKASFLDIYNNASSYLGITADHKAYSNLDTLEGRFLKLPYAFQKKLCQQVVNTDKAFALLSCNGTVYTFGKGEFGGGLQREYFNWLRPLQHNIILSSKITSLAADRAAFVALTEDGKAFVWGDPQYGGSLKGEYVLPSSDEKGEKIIAVAGTREHLYLEFQDGNIYQSMEDSLWRYYTKV